MKKYFIAFFLFCLSLIVIDNVYAANGSNWVNNLKQPVSAYNYACSSESNCTTSKNVYPGDISQYIAGDDLYTGGSIYTTESYTMPTNGMAWVINTGNSFRKGYIYMMTVYVCLTEPSAYFVIDDYSVSTAGNSYQFGNVKQLYNSGNTISSDNFITSNPNNMRCQYYSTLFVPKIDAKTYNIKLDTNTTVTAYYSLLGYETILIGLDDAVTNESLTSAIGGSGLATADSIDEVKEAQQQIKDDIVQNQNDNTQQTIDSQKVCKNYDKTSIKLDNSFLNSQGEINTANAHGMTDYIPISSKDSLTVNPNINSSGLYSCFYNDEKVKISCFQTYNSSGAITIPSNAFYFRGSINKGTNLPTFTICKNGNQAMNDSINNVNDTLNNSDSSGATDEAGGFFSNFNTDTHGLTGIITAPLSAIQGLINNTCTPLVIPLPFVNRNLTLPCLSSVYSTYFGNFFTMYQTITLGIVSYWVLVRIFALVKDFKNPEHDEIEVVEL